MDIQRVTTLFLPDFLTNEIPRNLYVGCATRKSANGISRGMYHQLFMVQGTARKAHPLHACVCILRRVVA